VGPNAGLFEKQKQTKQNRSTRSDKQLKQEQDCDTNTAAEGVSINQQITLTNN